MRKAGETQGHEAIADAIVALIDPLYKNLISGFRTSNIDAILGIVNNDHFFETVRGGNHDEERIVNMFEGDLMATGRYLAMIDLFGGLSTTVICDELG